MICTIAMNYLGDMIIRDVTGQTHVFRNQEAKAIGTAIYKHKQTKKALIHKEEIIVNK